jgi:hypothetical protein
MGNTGIHRKAVETEREAEYRRNIKRARHRWQRLRASHRSACWCPLCQAEFWRFVAVADHKPCRLCRGVGRGVPGTGEASGRRGAETERPSHPSDTMSHHTVVVCRPAKPLACHGS